MDDGHTDDHTEEFDPFAGAGPEEDDPLVTEPESDPWPGVGARRSPRPPAEGVRIIGADEAAAAIESGQATRRSPGDAPRFGDVPEPPQGPRPPLRFPGADPAAVAKPPIASPPPRPAEGRVSPSRRDSYVEESFWDEPTDPPTDPPGESAGGAWSGSGDWSRDPSGPSERVGAGMSSGGPADRVGGSTSGPQGYGDAGYGDSGYGDSGSGGGSGGGSDSRFSPRATYDPDAPGPRAGGFGAESEDERYAGLPGESEEYEYEPFFAPATPLDPTVPSERAAHGPGGSSEGEPSGATGPAERGAPGPVGGQGAGPALPHWTEPPSGEVPRILPDAEAEADPDDDLKAWSTLSTGPRWRDQPTDWDEADFGGAAVLDDPEMRLGALRADPPEEEDPYPVEEQGLLPEAAPPTRGRQGRGATPAPADPQIPQGPPVPSRRPRRPDPRARGRNIRPAVGDPGAPRQPLGGGGLSQLGGHELQIRVITGAVVLAVLLLAAKLGPGALAFVVAVVLTMAAAELYQAVRTHGYHPATLLGLAATAALVAVAYWKPGDGAAYLLVPVLLVIFSFLWFLTGVSRARPIANIGVTLMGFMYVGFLGSFAAALLTFPLDHGIGLLLGAILATAAYDTGAYFVGAWTGRTPLMPQISPGKTVEGLVGGTFATLVMCILLVRAIHPWDGGRAFWLFVVVSVAAPLGDLCESMIKRELGVKDMGGIMPGHGGVLDRIDALLFVIPATFYLTRVLNFA